MGGQHEGASTHLESMFAGLPSSSFHANISFVLRDINSMHQLTLLFQMGQVLLPCLACPLLYFGICLVVRNRKLHTHFISCDRWEIRHHSCEVTSVFQLRKSTSQAQQQLA
jgi:hypothetical protein